MDDILNKLLKTEKKNKKEITLNQIELEIQLRIENEKRKQLELIKDIKKIEKSIKQKELYNKRTYFTCRKCIKNNRSDESDEETDIDSDLYTDDELSETDYDIDDDRNIQKAKAKKIKDNNLEKENYEDIDSLSMCTSESESESDIYYLDYDEIDIICLK